MIFSALELLFRTVSVELSLLLLTTTPSQRVCCAALCSPLFSDVVGGFSFIPSGLEPSCANIGVDPMRMNVNAKASGISFLSLFNLLPTRITSRDEGSPFSPRRQERSRPKYSMTNVGGSPGPQG